MTFAWIKRYMPRSLYGRAVLILLVPIVTLQVVVAGIFIQRHFDGVTRQLVSGVALEIRTIAERIDKAGGIDEMSLSLAAPLNLPISLAPGPLPAQPGLNFWDITGQVIIEEMNANLDRPLSVDLASNFRRAYVHVALADQVLRVDVPRRRMSASNPHQLIVLMIAASLILTYISLKFLGNQVRPIRHLARAAEAFGKGQSEPFRPSGADEVRRAGTAFLAMRGRIERQIEQRTHMLSGVSHDLRTPLTRMKLGLATADGPEDVAALQQDVSDMERMLSEFLAFAQGDGQEDSKEVPLAAFVDRIVGDCARLGIDVGLRSIGLEETTTIDIREMAVTRAIQNLINNADRHGTTVRLTVHVRPRSISFSIEDDGPGIPADARAEALRPFARLDAARNQDKGGGVGLGLSIALDVARSHGGSLTLDDSIDLGGLAAAIILPR